MLGTPHGDIHDPGQYLHARLRLLRRALGQTGWASGRAGAGARRRSGATHGPAVCGGDFGQPETVPRLYREVRKGAIYERSLELLRRAKFLAPQMPTKTGLMLGLGETREEVLAAMQDLAGQGTDILTLGQYLQPTREHLPVVRFVHPDEFAEYKKLGEQMGFAHVESGPLVRSSYHAFEQEAAAHV